MSGAQVGDVFGLALKRNMSRRSRSAIEGELIASPRIMRASLNFAELAQSQTGRFSRETLRNRNQDHRIYFSATFSLLFSYFLVGKSVLLILFPALSLQSSPSAALSSTGLSSEFSARRCVVLSDLSQPPFP